MGNRLPKIFTGSRICIICEGDEEYEYLEKLISLDVWSKEYCFQLENAGGSGNIPARYQDKYQNGAYDLVLVFCDTDRKPYEQYVDIKRKIDEFQEVENAADKIMIYGNPCTRDSKTVYIGSDWKPVTYKTQSGEEKTITIRTGYEIINRTIDRHGQFLFPNDIEANTW